MMASRWRSLSLTAALVVAISSFFWLERATPAEIPIAVLYALPLFVAGSLLSSWTALGIGLLALSLYMADAILAGELWNGNRIGAFAVLVIGCWWALQTGRDHARLRAATTELTHKAAELARLRRDREAMNSIVAHELRGALSSVAGYSKLLLRKEASADRGADRGALRAIAEGSDRLDRLTQDLLDEANIELGHLRLNRGATNLVQILREQTEFYSELTGRCIELHADSDAIFGNWDELRVSQVIRNLLSNALKYSPDSSPVQAAVISCSDQAGFTIRNASMEIEPGDLEDVFCRHRRLDRHHHLEGSGLGLYITRCLVERHGGTIAASAANGHVEFRVTLPI